MYVLDPNSGKRRRAMIKDKAVSLAHKEGEMIARAGREIAAAEVSQAKIARSAFQRYGKGRHPAGLNFGDCFAYALAVSRGEPLLFKGDDFPLTDVPQTLPA